MTPEEKARELLDSHLDKIEDVCIKNREMLPYRMDNNIAKITSLITVNEIIKAFANIKGELSILAYEYWEDVKLALEKM